jgi:hypothetical protein
MPALSGGGHRLARHLPHGRSLASNGEAARQGDVLTVRRDMPLVRRSSACENMNHRRSEAPVGHCPECGGVVNARLAVTGCTEDKHAAARRRQSTFCVDCGSQLMLDR